MLPFELRKLPFGEPDNDISDHFNSTAAALCGYVKTAARETVVAELKEKSDAKTNSAFGGPQL
jgi:hypothetical protein